MTLKEALLSQGNSLEEVNSIIKEMVERILIEDYPEDPEELLAKQGLGRDYVFDLIDYCLGYEKY